MNRRGITISFSSGRDKGGLTLRIPAATLYLLIALPVGFFAVLLLAYLFYPIPAGYQVNGAESSAVVERLSFVEKELAVSHEMAARMARLVGVELSNFGGKSDSGKGGPRASFQILAGDANGARIFPLDGRIANNGNLGLLIYFDKKDTLRASGPGIVAEVLHNNLVNWKVTINHENGYISDYSGNFSPWVKAGDKLNIGEGIGLAAPRRFGSGKIEFRVFKGGQAVNPFAAFLDEGAATKPVSVQKSDKSRNLDKKV